MGVSLRDYDTFIRAIAELPYPAAIPEFSFLHFENPSGVFPWARDTIPSNLTILRDTGDRQDLLRNMARARLVVIPIQPNSLCASGISTYLDAMYLGKCVITTEGPGASDLLTDQAILVPPTDVIKLREAIRRAWEDGEWRRSTALAGQQYALSLGGEKEMLQRIFRQSVTAFSNLERTKSGHPI
jgi:glycosyltransferase involved in cell wall biosynthesis